MSLVIDDSKMIELFRLLAIKNRLKLELKGIKFKINTFVQVRKEFKIKERSRKKVYEIFMKILEGYINDIQLLDPSSAYYDERIANAAAEDMNLIKSSGQYVSDADMDNDGIGISFTESFEPGWAGWTAIKTSSTSVISLSQNQAHEGIKSVQVYQTVDNGDTILYKTFSIDWGV